MKSKKKMLKKIILGLLLIIPGISQGYTLVDKWEFEDSTVGNSGTVLYNGGGSLYTTGIVGTGVQFGPSSVYYNNGGSSSFLTLPDYSSFSINFWIKKLNEYSGLTLQSNYFYAISDNNYTILQIRSYNSLGYNKIYMECWGNLGGTCGNVYIGDTSDEQRHMVTIVVNGTQTLYYYDGSLVGTNTGRTANFANTLFQNLTINRNTSTTYSYIDELSIYDGQLDATAITDLYINPSGLPTTNYVAYTGIDFKTIQGIDDQSSANIDIITDYFLFLSGSEYMSIGSYAGINSIYTGHLHEYTNLLDQPLIMCDDSLDTTEIANCTFYDGVDYHTYSDTDVFITITHDNETELGCILLELKDTGTTFFSKNSCLTYGSYEQQGSEFENYNFGNGLVYLSGYNWQYTLQSDLFTSYTGTYTSGTVIEFDNIQRVCDFGANVALSDDCNLDRQPEAIQLQTFKKEKNINKCKKTVEIYLYNYVNTNLILLDRQDYVANNCVLTIDDVIGNVGQLSGSLLEDCDTNGDNLLTDTERDNCDLILVDQKGNQINDLIQFGNTMAGNISLIYTGSYNKIGELESRQQESAINLDATLTGSYGTIIGFLKYFLIFCGLIVIVGVFYVSNNNN